MNTSSSYTPEMTTTTTPRERSKNWQVGDIVQVGAVRWAIRTITKGRGVELEAMSASPGMWWTTTLANLPKKTR